MFHRFRNNKFGTINSPGFSERKIATDETPVHEFLWDFFQSFSILEIVWIITTLTFVLLNIPSISIHQWILWNQMKFYLERNRNMDFTKPLNKNSVLGDFAEKYWLCPSKNCCPIIFMFKGFCQVCYFNYQAITCVLGWIEFVEPKTATSFGLDSNV